MKYLGIIKPNLYKYLLTLFLTTGFFSLNAQTIEIKGLVKDSVNQPLIYANVFAVPQDKNVQIAFATSNEKGFYQLKIKKNKKYNVTTSYLGYVPKKVTFQFIKDTIFNFKLLEDKNQLSEVNITYTIPVVVKQDTITYNIDSFVTGNERKLKDVLKKLPGIEVDRKGNVLVHGKKVTTLLVEDKPFFGGNTKLGVNNIPADAIDKVQVLENYNSVAMLKGLQDEDKVALNIKLKEDKKKFIFGNIELGAGIKEKYVVHPKLFYYSPKTSANFIGDVTNTGVKSFAMKDYLEFEGGMSKMFSNPSSYFKLYRSDFSKYLANQDYKADKTIFGALNIRQSVNNVTDLSMYVISAKSQTDTQTTTNNQYLYGVSFIENRDNTKETSNFYTIGKLSLDYDPNKKTDYAFSSFFTISDSKSNSNITTQSLSNNTQIENTANLEAFSLQQNVSLNNDLSNKHTLTFNANYTYQKDKPNLAWNTNQELLENLIPITLQNFYKIRQNKRIKSQSFTALVKDYWTLHRFHHLYTSFGVNKASTSFFNSDYQIVDNGSINNFSTAQFGNDFNYNFLDTFLGLDYKFKVGKITFKPALYYHNYQWNTQQVNQLKRRFNKNILLPQFTVKVAFRNSEKLNFKYRLNARFPNAKSLLNNYILSSFNHVFKGNTNLTNSLYHSVSLSYYKFNLYKGYNIFLNTSYNKKIQSIKNVTQLDGINQFSTQIMLDEPETNYALNGVFSKTINKLKSKIKTGYRYADYYQLVNNTQTQNKSTTFYMEPSIKTLFKKLPNIEIGYKKDFTTYINTSTTKYTNERFFSYLDYDYKDFIVEANFEYNTYKNKTDQSIQNNYINANASIFYQKEDSDWGFEVKVSNLFNATYKQSNSQSDFIISDSKTYILPRVVLFKVIYKL